MRHDLKNLGFLEIICPTGESVAGGSQEWFPGRWERASGCGPTAASNLIWYMTRSRPGFHMLFDAGGGGKDNFVELMRELFVLIPPGIRGVNDPAIFTDGVIRFGAARSVTLTPRVLEIPSVFRKRPDIDSVGNFIISALQADSPVGFLNLSNGKLSNLEAWHWVTIIGLESESMVATISDKGRKLDICLAEWLRTSILGGAMVYIT